MPSEGAAPDLPRLTKPFRNDELIASLAEQEGGRGDRPDRSTQARRKADPARADGVDGDVAALF